MKTEYQPDTLASMQELAKVVSVWLDKPERIALLRELTELMGGPEAGVLIRKSNAQFLITPEASEALFKALHFVIGLCETAKRMSIDADLFHQEQVDPKNN
ncbi:MAG: hypothetical protein E6R03_08980 [Hyphomicrobiaceae bacterium]|nr:MAG: hypothetical protein E6R03_08980 [Hyphomicrobiaceae bacterium]